MHEAQQNEHNQFVTLTYGNDNLPNYNSLHKPHLQKFWKRLRKRTSFRYYACGEYGDETYRPHYHALVFGLNLSDKIPHRVDNGNQLYTSKSLERMWGHGHVIIGNVTFESCAYVARYIMKKTLGTFAHTDYEVINTDTGQVIDTIEPEYSTMSQGIGKSFYEQYKSDMYQNGTDGNCIIRNGIRVKTPKYYDNRFKLESENNTQRLEEIQKLRATHVDKENNTRERLITREKIALSTINNKLPRKLT